MTRGAGDECFQEHQEHTVASGLGGRHVTWGAEAGRTPETHQIPTETPNCTLLLNEPMQVSPGRPLAALCQGSESLHESHPRGC